MDLDNLRYPIGLFQSQDSYTLAEVKSNIQIISALPSKFINLLGSWEDDRLNTPYRPGGWTVRQLVHHIADSHMNAYVRFKLALTEDEPTIKPYDEAAWAELADTAATEPDVSLKLIEALHVRWVALLRAVPEPAYQRTLRHPEHGRTFTLDQLLAQY